MAEFLLRDLAQKQGLDIQTRSAGIYAVVGAPATEETVAVLEEWGIDAREHRSQPLSWELLDWADLILTMETWHKQYILAKAPELQDRVFVLTEFVGEDGEVPDPYGTARRACREIRDLIQQLVSKVIYKLQNKSEG